MEVTINWFDVKDDPCYEECKAYQYWNPMTIQVMHCEPAIKNLLVALSSVHRYLREDKDINNEVIFLNAYTTALRELATNTPDISIVLMACMMMCTLEAFRGQTRAFYHHLHAGLRILKQFDENAEPKNTHCNERIRVFLRPALYNSKLNAVAMTEYGLLDPKVLPSVKLQEMKTWNKIPIASQVRNG